MLKRQEKYKARISKGNKTVQVETSQANMLLSALKLLAASKVLSKVLFPDMAHDYLSTFLFPPSPFHLTFTMLNPCQVPEQWVPLSSGLLSVPLPAALCPSSCLAHSSSPLSSPLDAGLHFLHEGFFPHTGLGAPSCALHHSCSLDRDLPIMCLPCSWDVSPAPAMVPDTQ